MTIKNSTKEIYNNQSFSWARVTPSIVSDFTGRPPTLEMCGNVKGKSVLDLGCGEGYCTRILASQCPREIIGVDISDEMINRAVTQEQIDQFGINYICADANSLEEKNLSLDLILAMFVFNYISIEEMKSILKNVYKLLKDNGEFVFAVPHPSLAFIRKSKSLPFYFDSAEYDYFSARNNELKGQIWRRSGEVLNVRSYHKTFEDYFDVIKYAGFSNIDKVKELYVTDDIFNIDPIFFEPLRGIPLHVAFKLIK